MSKWKHIDKQHSDIIANIKSERIKQGLSQEKLAEKSGLSIRAIGMIESGERKPTLYNYLRICDALEIRNIT
jgi:transcriptional regulator with XRE-family HTH domain